MKSTQLKLKLLKGEFTIHRFSANSEMPVDIFESDFFTISKTDDEISIVCDSAIEIKSEKSKEGWSCFKVLGPLDFSLTGILADITSLLAKENISIFAISTYDTDYIFVPTEQVESAKREFYKSGYIE